MQEQLVSLQTAKLAKLKGFDEPTLTGFHGSKIHDVLYSDVLEGLTKYNTLRFTYEGVKTWTSAPAQSLLQRWLREVHYLDICINPHYKVFGGIAGYLVDVYDQGRSGCLFSNGMDSYELALEQGLQAALKLIK